MHLNLKKDNQRNFGNQFFNLIAPQVDPVHEVNGVHQRGTMEQGAGPEIRFGQVC